MANEVRHRGFGRWTIEDDRGHARALRSGSGRKLLSARQRRAERRAQWLSGGGFRPLDWFVFAIGMMATMWVSDWVYANWIQPSWPGAPKSIATIAMIPMFVPFMGFVHWRVNRATAVRRPVVNRILTGTWVCPACHGSLGGREPNHDGFVACPQCDASWAASRFNGPSEPEYAPIDTMGRAESLLTLMLERSAPLVAKDDAGKQTVLISGSVSVPIVDSPSSKRQRRLEQIGSGQVFPRSLVYIVAGTLAAIGVVAMTGFTMFVAVGVAALIVWIDLRQEPRRIRRAALALYLCPSCAEDLEAVPPGSDGFVRCPLCDAAWRAEAIGDQSRSTMPVHA